MSTETASHIKRCVQCKKDLEGQKRMKDSKGQYWCYECGSKDEATKAKEGKATMVQLCAKCKSPTHARDLFKTKKGYVCEKCASGSKEKVATEKDGTDIAKKEKRKMIAALVMVGCGVLLLGAGFYFEWITF